ncbi:hypothetical protein T492DRAFT_936162 [Pavlovales sp. CCMP2436]|nr:hypothetical protein T492DRAFT_936162 [Pavlovales sp. CCMP2436]
MGATSSTKTRGTQAPTTFTSHTDKHTQTIRPRTHAHPRDTQQHRLTLQRNQITYPRPTTATTLDEEKVF